MNVPFLPSDLRHWADKCLDEANNPRASGEERARVLKMRESLLALADNQDWLNGQRSPSTDEGQSSALAESSGQATLE
jgi:hypothetical protein